MIRVVVQHSPSLYSLALEHEDALTPVIEYDGSTYYRAATKHHYVFYKSALSGWGAAAPDPTDPRAVFDPRQR